MRAPSQPLGLAAEEAISIDSGRNDRNRFKMLSRLVEPRQLGAQGIRRSERAPRFAQGFWVTSPVRLLWPVPQQPHIQQRPIPEGELRTVRPNLIASIVIGTIALIALFSPPVAASHWSGSGSFGPSSAYQGVSTSFTFHMVNAAPSSLDVNWAYAHFCWMATSPDYLVYYLKPDDGTKVSIPGGGSHDFTIVVPVDETTTGNCAVAIKVNGQAGGDFFAESADYSATINVLVIPPLQLSIAASPNNGEAPLSVSFSSTVTGGLSPYSYSWTFGDGGVSSASTPSHTFSTAGSYTATLIVVDSKGNQRTDDAVVTVTAPGSTPGTGLSGNAAGIPLWIFLLIGVVGVAALAGGALFMRSRKGAATPPPQAPPTAPRTGIQMPPPVPPPVAYAQRPPPSATQPPAVPPAQTARPQFCAQCGSPIAGPFCGKCGHKNW